MCSELRGNPFENDYMFFLLRVPRKSNHDCLDAGEGHLTCISQCTESHFCVGSYHELGQDVDMNSRVENP